MKELLDGISVDRLEFYANNEPPFGYTGSDIQTMARIALAVKQAQPITVDLKDVDTDAVKAAFAKGMDRYSGAMLAIADGEDNTALQNFRAAMEGIGHIRRTLEETFGGLHGTHVEPDVLVECKAICDAICAAYLNAGNTMVVLPGWQLMPTKLTDAMRESMAEHAQYYLPYSLYEGLLKTAPQPEVK